MGARSHSRGKCNDGTAYDFVYDIACQPEGKSNAAREKAAL